MIRDDTPRTQRELGIPLITLQADFIPLREDYPTGITSVRLPHGSLVTSALPGAGNIGRRDRDLMDGARGQSFVAITDGERRGPTAFAPSLLRWAMQRSELVIVWGAAALPEAVTLVETWCAQLHRATVILSERTRQGEWLQVAARTVPPHRLSSLLWAPEAAPDGFLPHVPFSGSVH